MLTGQSGKTPRAMQGMSASKYSVTNQLINLFPFPRPTQPIKNQKAVSEFTENEAGDVELNPIIMTYCRSAMDRFCDKINRDNGEMMECLISHKNDPDMKQDQKCRAALEHFQIITQKKYHFTYRFKIACRPFVIRYCHTSSTKNDVVACLR